MIILLRGMQIMDDDYPFDQLAINSRTGLLVKPTSSADKIVDLDGMMIFPALINAHDHLELNHFPRTKFQPTYPNAHAWGEDVSQRLSDEPFASLQKFPLWQRCLIGGLKNMLSGVTTVVHHNPYHRPFRKKWFPVDVIQDYGWAHSLHFSTADEIRSKFIESNPYPFYIHLAEGTDHVSTQEFDILRNIITMNNRLILIHGVGLTDTQIQQAIDHHIKLVWSPSTNDYLLGQTANIQTWQKANLLMLGSDSRLTADGDLLDEMRKAQSISQLSAREIVDLVTIAPANLLNLTNRGSICIGNRADLIAISQHDDPYQALINTHRHHIHLVMRGGKVVMADESIASHINWQNFTRVVLDEQPKFLERRLARQIRKSKLQEEGLTI